MATNNNIENDLFAKIDFGVKRGVARALAEHKKAGKSIVISQNGKIIKIPPEKIDIPDEFKYLLAK
jgi:hypothetical protein